jgi:hypothetical protein
MRQENIAFQAATGVATKAIPATNLLYCSAQCSGVTSGTMVIQASNDHPVASGATPTNWTQIATVTISGAGAFMIPTTAICYEYVRILYTGSGTATVNFCGQGQ